ncbi:hypothetical protein V6Z11_D09G029200 [Gossypium hirsutum]
MLFHGNFFFLNKRSVLFKKWLEVQNKQKPMQNSCPRTKNQQQQNQVENPKQTHENQTQKQQETSSKPSENRKPKTAKNLHSWQAETPNRRLG